MKNFINTALAAIFFLFIMNPPVILSNESSEHKTKKHNPFVFTTQTYEPKKLSPALQSTQEKLCTLGETTKDRRCKLQQLQEQFIKLLEEDLVEKEKASQIGFAAVQKISLDDETKVIMHGDLHGNYESLRNMLNQAINDGLIAKKSFDIPGKTVIICLGDYSDRGTKGLEVWTTLMQLKLKNPDKVFLLKGNHEDTALSRKLGFGQELINKLQIRSTAKLDEILQQWQKCFDLLPEMLILDWENNDPEHTHTYLPCIHGGIESYACTQDDELLRQKIQKNCATICTMLQNNQKQAWIDLRYKPYYTFVPGDIFAWEEEKQKDTYKFKSPYTWFDVSEDPNARDTKAGTRGYSAKTLGASDFEFFQKNAFPAQSAILAFFKGHCQNNRPLFEKASHPGIARLLGGLVWTLDYIPENAAATDTWVILEKNSDLKQFSAKLLRFPPSKESSHISACCLNF